MQAQQPGENKSQRRERVVSGEPCIFAPEKLFSLGADVKTIPSGAQRGHGNAKCNESGVL